MKQMYLHATYDDKIAVPERSSMITILPPPLYMALGPGAGATAVECRLVRSKILLGRKAAETELTRVQRYNSVIFGNLPKNYLDHLTKVNSRDRSKAYGNALQASSAFTNLLQRNAQPEDMDRLMLEGYQVIQTARRKFEMQHAIWISEGCKGRVTNLSDITLSEDMFLREDVSCEESLKIPGIPLTVRFKGSLKVALTKTKVGLYEIGSSQHEWAQNLGYQLVNERNKIGFDQSLPKNLVREIFYENREWVTDDCLIVGHITEWAMKKNVSSLTVVVIASTDKKLAQRVADSANLTVALLDPTEYKIICDRNGIGLNDQRVLRYLQPVFIKDLMRSPSYICVDTGSSCAHLSKREKYQGKIFKKALLSSGRMNGLRTEKYSMTEDRLTSSYLYITYAKKNKSSRSSYSGSSDFRKAHSQGSVYSASS